MRTRSLRSAALAMLLVTAGGSDAWAYTVDATSTTLVQGRSEPADGSVRTVVPIFEIVGLRARDLDVPVVDDLGFTLQAWGRVEPAHSDLRIDDAADLDLAYFSGRVLDRHLDLKLGRHMVFNGAARTLQLDGLSTEARLYKGFGLQAYGGLPVIPRFAVARGDAVAGGRVFYRRSIDAEIGGSFIQVWDHGDTARQSAGFDFRLVPVRTLTLSGLGLWSVVEDGRIEELDFRATLQPVDGFQVWADARRTAPDLFLPRTSIFSVFAVELRDEIGGGVFYRPLPRLRLWADYYYFEVEKEPGHNAQLRGSYEVTDSSTVGLQVRGLDAPINGYLQGRVWAIQRFVHNLNLSLDADVYHYGEEVNGERNSYVAQATASWGFAPGWMAALTGLGSVTPFYESRLEVLAKLVYNFSTSVREVSP